MKPHTRIYIKYFGYGEQDYIPCEVCNSRAVDIHHIERRGMGGNPTGDKDRIENLAALCRICHEKAECSMPFNDYVKSMHSTKLRLWKKH